LDRFYTASDHLYDIFLEWANKQPDLYYKVAYKNRDQKRLITKKGEEFVVNMRVNLNTEGYDSYPYIDTFQWGGEGYLINYEDGRFTYDNTNGSRGGGGVYDEIDGCYIDEDDSVYVETAGVTTHVDNCVYSEHRDQYILISE